MAIGPLDDIYGHKAFWHVHSGQALPYRLLYPYDYDPNQSYPLIVYLPGDGAYGTGYDNVNQVANGGFGKTYFGAGGDGATYTALAQAFPCFVISLLRPVAQPATYDGLQNWMDTESSYYRQNNRSEGEVKGYVGCGPVIGYKRYQGTHTLQGNPIPEYNQFTYAYHQRLWREYDEGGDCWFIQAALSLIRSLINGSNTFYTKSDLSASTTPTAVNIDSDRVYYLGYSRGTPEGNGFLSGGKEIFAGAVLVDAYMTTGLAYSYNESSNLLWRSMDKKDEAAAKVASSYSHIPILVYSADKDGGGDLDQVHPQYPEDIHKWLLLAGAENSHLITKVDGSHSLSVVMSQIYTFDSSNTISKQYVGTEVGVGYKTVLDWLFELTKPAYTYSGCPSQFIGGRVPDAIYRSGIYWSDSRLTRIGIDEAEKWPYSDCLYPLEYLHDNGRKTINNLNSCVFEVVDKNCDTVIVIGREYRITNEQVDGDTYKLVWDKDAYAQEFTTAGQTATIKTASGRYTLEYLGQVTGYKNQRFRLTGPKKSGVFAHEST